VGWEVVMYVGGATKGGRGNMCLKVRAGLRVIAQADVGNGAAVESLGVALALPFKIQGLALVA